MDLATVVPSICQTGNLLSDVLTRMHCCNILDAISNKNINCISTAVPNQDPVPIETPYDAAWPKEGNGYTCDSLADISSSQQSLKSSLFIKINISVYIFE